LGQSLEIAFSLEPYIDNTDKMDSIVKELINLPGLKILTLGTGLTGEGLIQLKNIQFPQRHKKKLQALRWYL